MTPTNPNRRAEIIDAAERRFASQGYLQTSVSEIIGDAGIAKGTFYHYFQSKESVMYAVIDKNITLLKDQVESYMAESTQPPLDQFTMILGGGFAPRRPETAAISTELEQDGNELMHMRTTPHPFFPHRRADPGPEPPVLGRKTHWALESVTILHPPIRSRRGSARGPTP